METYNKITIGFVAQKYVTVGGKHICVGQEFIAGDQVDYEDLDGEPVTVDIKKEQYQQFDMVNPLVLSSENGLVFTCPKCHKHRLECCENGAYASEVTNIDEDGDFDFGSIDASGIVDRFQCLDCGFVLEDKDYNANIDEHEEIVKWILANCEQP